jgi:hypothetical protein
MGNDSYACHLEKIGTIRKKDEIGCATKTEVPKEEDSNQDKK